MKDGVLGAAPREGDVCAARVREQGGGEAVDMLLRDASRVPARSGRLRPPRS